MKQKNNPADELVAKKVFDYKLRGCTLTFSLTTLLEMKDFRQLLLKGLQDLDKAIVEKTEELKTSK